MSLFISSLPLFEHEQNGANHFTEELITRSETEPISDVKLREVIHRATNKMEQYNALED